MERVEHINIIKTGINEVWDYLINPNTLKELAPDHFDLKMLTKDLPSSAYVGLTVKYTISPKPGVVFTIENVFTEIEPKTFYATEIINGVFDFWRYEHILRQLPSSGTEIKNIVFFKPIVGSLSKSMDLVFIKHEIDTIFKHRAKVIQAKLGKH